MARIPAVKRPNRRSFVKTAFTLALIAGAGGPAVALSDRFLHDPYTGIAIGGYDPVAYFVNGRAVPGHRDLEVSWEGGYWWFANAGNAAAFEDAPDVYAPAYGGYGVAGVARGVPQPADPRLFAVYRDRLFFFMTAEDLAGFRADPDSLIAAADAHWPHVRQELAD